MDDEVSRAELIALVRHQRETIDELRGIIAKRDAEIVELREQLETMHFRVSQMSRRIYGNVSERFAATDGQTTIPGLVPNLMNTAADSDEDDDPDQPPRGGQRVSKRSSAKKTGRLTIPDHVERVDQVIEPDPQNRIDSDGRPLPKLREEVTEKLDYVAGGFRALRIIRPVYGRPDEPSVSAPPPPQIIDRGLPTDRTVAMVLSEKFDLHNPCYRQQGRFARAGLSIPRSTLGNWIAGACRALDPIYREIAADVRTASVLHLDDTIIERLDPGRGRTHTARFWGYLGNGALCVRYADNRAGSHPQQMLSDWSGAVIADAYSGHEALYHDGTRQHLPCMAHVRRKFHEAYRDAGDRRAQPVLASFQRLYALEKAWQNRPPDQRATLRQDRAAPILDDLHGTVQRLAVNATPRSPLGRACRYFLKLWPRMTGYLSCGEAAIDNNALERLWKPVALGRKNYLFVGNEAGGERAATAYTITLSCRLAGVDTYRYLCDTFAELHRGATPASELTPKAWALRNNAHRSAA